MTIVAAIALALLFGLTLAGLVGSLLELWAGRRLAFAEPFVCRSRPLRSLAITAAAGPFMLVNEALRLRRGAALLAGCLALAAVWLLCAGVVLAELAFALRGLFS